MSAVAEALSKMLKHIFHAGLLLLLGCYSPHGGYRIPGAPDEAPPNVYGRMGVRMKPLSS